MQAADVTKGVGELTAKDSDMSLTVNGTAGQIAELQSICRYLDVKPRTLKVEMRLFVIWPQKDGTEKEDLLGTPTLTSTNNTDVKAKFNATTTDMVYIPMLRNASVAMVPHINGDNSVSLRVTITFRQATKEAPPSEIVFLRRIQQKQWVSLGTLNGYREETMRTEHLATPPLLKMPILSIAWKRVRPKSKNSNEQGKRGVTAAFPELGF